MTQPAVCMQDACTQACTTECRAAINSAWTALRGSQPAERYTVDTITSDALDQLYTERDALTARLYNLGVTVASPEPSWQCPDCAGLVPASQQYLHQEAEQRARAEQAEAELTALKTITTGYCPECGRGDCSPTASQWYQQVQRADRADAAIERVRALHHPVPSPYGDRTICADCSGYGGDSCDNTPQSHPCPTIRALDSQEPQPEAAPAVEPEPVCTCPWGGPETRRCPVHEPTT